MPVTSAETARRFLKDFSQQDGNTDLCSAAIALSALYKGEFDLRPLFTHFDEIYNLVAVAYRRGIDDGRADDITLRHQALIDVIYGDLGYRGDDQDYDNLKNALMADVVDRRKGLPVALGIIFIQAARAQGWDAVGLKFPGHFVVRLSHGTGQILVDPFREGQILNAGDLRNMLKVLVGSQAELSHSFYEEASDAEILVRLQNNLKTRLIEAEDYEAALKAIDSARLCAPNEYRLLFDSAMLKVKTGQIKGAQDDIQDYITAAPTVRERQEAEQLLYEIQRQMN